MVNLFEYISFISGLRDIQRPRACCVRLDSHDSIRCA